EKACPGLDPGWIPVFGKPCPWARPEGSCSKNGLKRDADPGLEPPSDQEAGNRSDRDGAEDLATRALAHQTGGVVHRLLGGFRDGGGRIVQIDALLRLSA